MSRGRTGMVEAGADVEILASSISRKKKGEEYSSSSIFIGTLLLDAQPLGP